MHNELVCVCPETERISITNSLKLKTINAYCYKNKVKARMPILPIKIISPTVSRLIYVLLHMGSESQLSLVTYIKALD